MRRRIRHTHRVVCYRWSGGCRGSAAARRRCPMRTSCRVGQLVFHSDFELPSDHRLVRELTAERDDICHTLGLPSSNEADRRVSVSRCRALRRNSWRGIFPSVPSRRAFFLETDTRLAVYAHWSDRVAEDLRHEVAHGYLHAVVPGLPLWLDEGLAEYFEVPRGQSGLNRPHVDLLADMMRAQRLAAESGAAGDAHRRRRRWISATTPSRGPGSISCCTRDAGTARAADRLSGRLHAQAARRSRSRCGWRR